MSTPLSPAPSDPAARAAVSASAPGDAADPAPAFWRQWLGPAPMRRAQLTAYAETQYGTWAAGPVLFGLIGLAFLEWMSIGPIAAWVAVVTAAHVGLHLEIAHIRRLGREAKMVFQHERRVVVATLLYTAVWSSFGLLFWVPGDFTNNALIIGILAVSLAPVALLGGYYPPIFLACATPISVTVMVLVLRDLTFILAAVGALIATLLFYLSALALRHNKTLRQMFELSDDKTRLIEALSDEKLAADQARLAAEDASLAKSMFLANMSHELRTPLNAIIGFSEVMREEMFGPHAVPTYKEYANDIHRSGQHLLALISDILDLSRIEAGSVQLADEDIDVGEAIQDCRRLVGVRAADRHIQIKLEIDPTLPKLRGDGRAFRQILINLLSNAIKFSPSSTTTTVRVGRERDGWLEIRITDQGPGISQSEIDQIIEAFVQGKAGLTTEEAGTGLGLPIVKGYVAAHDGRFELRSAPGCGTQAIVRFPPDRVVQKNQAAWHASL